MERGPGWLDVPQSLSGATGPWVGTGRGSGRSRSRETGVRHPRRE